ncbi:MAG: nitroreductase [Pseudomonadota bacterium]
MIDHAKSVEAAITSRRSIRAFRPDPVSAQTVRHILEVAARAPSGTNMQPWQVHVLTGQPLTDFTDKMQAAFAAPDTPKDALYKYYPDQFFEPYKSRRRKVGLDLYSLLGLGKEDGEGMFKQHRRNYAFFDAPVGMIFTLDERLEVGSILDYGMFLQNIMIVARGMGLDTCPQAAFTPYGSTIQNLLGLEESEKIVCGMALGYADETAIENTLKTERAPLEDWVRFHAE